MGIYALASGKIFDASTAVKFWRSDWADASLCLFADGSYVLFVWDEEKAYEVKGPEDAHQKISDIGPV